MVISEEERYANFHILGAPGEGKSKFLEHEIRQDIDNNLNPKIPFENGLCLIDPSDKGDTVRNVLDYCASINFKKVIVIDPLLTKKYSRVPCLAPLSSKAVNRSVAGAMEALAMLFKSDYGTMRRIRRYLSALLRILARNNLTLYDTRYFSDYHLDKDKRAAIFGNDRDSYLINDLFRSPQRFDATFSSTVNFLDVLWQEPLQSLLNNHEGINFVEAVADGWVILVNLSPYAMTDEQAELLGIIVISQIIQATDILANRGWQGVFYLYIDEAGYFATPQIKTTLHRKRKSGLRVYLAHHDFQQFKGKEEILAAVEGSARIKLMFNTPGYDDRLRMIKSLGYGGDIPHALATYANSDLPKQHAVIKKNKDTPVRIRIPDVEPVPKASDEYIKQILSQSFYKDARIIPTNTQSFKPRKMDDSKTNSETPVSRGISEKLETTLRPDNKKPPEPPPKRPIKI